MIKDNTYAFTKIGFEKEITDICKAVGMDSYLRNGYIKQEYSLSIPGEDVENLIALHEMIKDIRSDMDLYNLVPERMTIEVLESRMEALEKATKEMIIKELPNYFRNREFPVSYGAISELLAFCEENCSDYYEDVVELETVWVKEQLTQPDLKKAEIEEIGSCYLKFGHTKEDFRNICHLFHIGEEFQKYYITFGNSEKLPFQNTYITIQAKSEEQARNIFKQLYQKEDEDAFGFCFLYNADEWENEVSRYYLNIEPAEKIQIDSDENLIIYNREKDTVCVQPYRNECLHVTEEMLAEEAKERIVWAEQDEMALGL